LFYWKLEEFPAMDYTIIKVGDGTGGGIMKNPMPEDPDSWLPYVLKDDIAVLFTASPQEGYAAQVF
jgi:predicted enzyme related to lactoylglutathione lyase